MKKLLLLSCLSFGSAVVSVARTCWGTITDLWSGSSSALDYLIPVPFRFTDETAEIQRADLARAQMPVQGAPTQRATRVTSDQRPSLRHFTLARNDFAY